MSFLTAIGDGRGRGKLISQIIYGAYDLSPLAPEWKQMIPDKSNRQKYPSSYLHS